MNLNDKTPPAAELEALVMEMPALARLRDFAIVAGEVSWFSQLGTVLDTDCRDIALGYLSALGFPHAGVARLHSWEEAAAAAENFDWDSEGWETEESLRAGLTADLLEQLSEEAMEIGLTFLAACIQEPVCEAATRAGTIWGEEDNEVLAAAMGAALQASHGGALAVATDAGQDHPFIYRFRLFERGRWPVGLAGQTYNIF